MKDFPILPHTDDKTFYTYSVYYGPPTYTKYVLRRHWSSVDTPDQVLDPHFEIVVNNFEGLLKQMTRQGFVPFTPSEEDRVNYIVKTFV